MSENVKEIQSRTIIPVESCKFTWSIENFSLSGLVGEEFMTSPMFTTGRSLSPTWYLRLHPNKNNALETDGNVAIYLQRNCKDSSVHYATYEISVIDSNKTKYCSRKLDYTFNEFRNSWGFPSFIARKTLFGTNQSLYLPLDVLTVICELKTSRVDNCKCSMSAKVIKESDSLPSNVFKKLDSLMFDLQQLYDYKMFTDFILKVGEEEFKVHKNILCARSSVFSTMLNCEMEEKLTNCVKITDFDPPIVRMMLHYIYCGKVENLTHEISFELYSAAEKYDLQGLKDICVDYLSSNLNVDNFCDVLTLGGLHSETGLMTTIRNFFSANAAVIKETENWLNLSKTNPDLVIAMYEVILSKIKI